VLGVASLLLLIYQRSPLLGYPDLTTVPGVHSLLSEYPTAVQSALSGREKPHAEGLEPISPDLLNELVISSHQLTQLINVQINNNLTDEDYYTNLKPFLWRGCGELCDFKLEEGKATSISWWKFYHKKHNCIDLYNVCCVIMLRISSDL
jgi:hypothetical protein